MNNKPQRKILIIEDCSEDQEIYQRYLNQDTEHHYVFLLATNRQEVFNLLDEKPDCVLLDYRLPDIDGLEFLEVLKEKNFTTLPIVMLSGMGSESIVVDALKKGAQDYLLKDDLNANNLIQAVNKAIKKVQAQDQLIKRYHQREIHLLIVEDNLEDRETYKRYLHQDTKYHYTFFFSEEVNEILQLCQTKQVDCLLLDYLLPHFDTLQFIRQMKKLNQQIPCPIIIITGQGSEHLAVKIMKLGVQDYLIKADINANKLIHAIHDAIEKVDTQRQLVEKTNQLTKTNYELEHALQTKDEFLAMISHELRTPLNAILGMSEVLEEKLYGDLNPKQIKCVDTIKESGHHLLGLINDLLDLSKITAGQISLKFQEVPIHNFCQSILRQTQQALKNKRLKISSSYDYSVEKLRIDKQRFKQILLNLLNNAVKFTSDGGSIGLEVIGDEEQQIVRFIVWDTGIGISTENFGHLFKPFVQLDSRLAREYEGTGLGLSLVYHLTEMHGGSVSVDSQFGQGSRFIVSLPWIPKPMFSEFTQESTDQSNQKPITILLAEDSQITIDTLFDYLTFQGYRVIIAGDGLQAIEKTKQYKPNLIIMDIQMPGMTGLEATTHIRAQADLAHIPIIALTALAMPGDRENCLAAGINEYLSKPVQLKKLIETIERLLPT